MAKTVQKKRIIGNPGARRSSSRGNPAIIGYSLAAGNPGRKAGRSMAKTQSKKKTSSHRGYSKPRSGKKNPGRRSGGKGHRPRSKGNPGGLSGVGPMVTNAVFVIVGALGSKLGAQAVLGEKNVGLMGYAGNAVAGGALWFLTEKVMRNRAASSGVIAGTIVQIVLRIINDYTPFGQYVAQLGMGDYQMQSFVTPQVLVDPWRNAEVAIPPGWAPKTVQALPAASGNGGGASVAATMSAAAPQAGLGGGLYGASSLY